MGYQARFKKNMYDTGVVNEQGNIYTASYLKHRIKFFQEKNVKLSKHEFILVTFIKIYIWWKQFSANCDSIHRMVNGHELKMHTYSRNVHILCPIVTFSNS